MSFWKLSIVLGFWIWLAGAAVAGLTDDASSTNACLPTLQDCTASEAWVVKQIRGSLQADLATHCTRDDDLYVAVCVRLRPRFVRDLIAATAVDEKVAPSGIKLRNAVICEARPPAAGSAESSAANENICDESIPLSEDPRSTIGARAFPLDLRDLRARVTIDLLGNHFICDLWLGGSYLEQGLNLDETIIDGSVDAHHLRTDSGLTLFNAAIRGDFDADGLRAQGSITLFRSQIFGALHMRGSIIGGDLDLGEVIILGPWTPTTPWMKNSERSSVGTPRSGLDLSNTRVSRQLYMSGTTVSTSNVDLSGITVEGSVWMENGTRLPWHLTMERARIGDSLLLGASQFNSIDLAGAHIARDMRIETNGDPVTWINGDFRRDQAGKAVVYDQSHWLVLRDARIGAIRDTLNAWPDCVEMTGLVYERPPHSFVMENLAAPEPPVFRWCRRGTLIRNPAASDNQNDAADIAIYETSPPEVTWLSWLGGARHPEIRNGGKPFSEAVAIRPSKWWINWLERDPERSLESYTQLATTLVSMGQGGIADDVRYAQRIFDRGGQSGGKWLLGYVEEALIGFGIGSYALWALLWAALFTGYGALRLRRHLRTLGMYPAAREKTFLWCWFASIQTLLPFITISKQMDDFLHEPIIPGVPSTMPLRGGLAIGFSLLALLGLLLSGFLLDGLRSYAGL